MELNYYANFVCTNGPFFIRGGRAGNTTGAGLYCFDRTSGESIVNDGIRVAVPYSDIKKVNKEMLSPKNTCLRICNRKYQRSLIPLVKSTINTIIATMN